MQNSKIPDSGWQFNSDADAPTNFSSQEVYSASVEWSASEYVGHEKTFSWYAITGLGAVILAVFVYFMTGHSWFSSLVILAVAGIFAAVAARPPRVLNYVISDNALKIGEKIYVLSNFKSFSVIDEGPIRSIFLAPLERFMPGLTVYYDPKDEEKITIALGGSLPYEAREAPLVDKLMRKIRF